MTVAWTLDSRDSAAYTVGHPNVWHATVPTSTVPNNNNHACKTNDNPMSTCTCHAPGFPSVSTRHVAFLQDLINPTSTQIYQMIQQWIAPMVVVLLTPGRIREHICIHRVCRWDSHFASRVFVVVVVPGSVLSRVYVSTFTVNYILQYCNTFTRTPLLSTAASTSLSITSLT
jgi:hypothetical protein